MNKLLEAYKINMEMKPLFSKIIDIDFYDGSTEALCQLVDSDIWLVCSIVFFDVEERERIYSLLEPNTKWLSEFNAILENRPGNNNAELYRKTKIEIENLYKKYSGEVFLFRGDSLTTNNYEITQISIKHLKYFKYVEDVLEQDKESKLLWINFFPKSP